MTKRSTTRPHSVYSRSRGICGVCPDEANEWALNDNDGRLRAHKILRNGKKVRCEGSGEYPTRVTHDPDMAIQRIATITTTPATPLPRYVNDARKQRRVRPRVPAAKVTVTRVDPKVLKAAQALARELGAGPVVVMFRTETV